MLAKRQDTPEVLNISVGAAMGEGGVEQPSETQPFSPPPEGELNSPDLLKKRNTIALVQQTAETLEDIRIGSNDDLDMFDDKDPDASATSEELSDASETYDFLMVYMPMIRPKEPDSAEEDQAADKKAKKGAKGKKGLKKSSTFMVRKLDNNLTMPIPEGGDSSDLQGRRNSNIEGNNQIVLLGQLGNTDEDAQ